MICAVSVDRPRFKARLTATLVSSADTILDGRQVMPRCGSLNASRLDVENTVLPASGPLLWLYFSACISPTKVSCRLYLVPDLASWSLARKATSLSESIETRRGRIIRGSQRNGQEELFRHFLSSFDRLDRLQRIDLDQGCQLGSADPFDAFHLTAGMLLNQSSLTQTCKIWVSV
jgi:hypothetical protein